MFQYVLFPWPCPVVHYNVCFSGCFLAQWRAARPRKTKKTLKEARPACALHITVQTGRATTTMRTWGRFLSEETVERSLRKIEMKSMPGQE